MMLTGAGMEQIDFDLQGMFKKIMPDNTRRELTVKEAHGILFEPESNALDQPKKVNAAAIELAENMGIVFIDEINKIVASCSPRGRRFSPRRATQSFPIVEGARVQTRYGHVRPTTSSSSPQASFTGRSPAT